MTPRLLPKPQRRLFGETESAKAYQLRESQPSVWSPGLTRRLFRQKHELRGAGALIVVGGDFEAEFFTDVPHGVVVGKNLAEDAVQLFHAANFYKLFQQLKTEAEILPFVADEQRKFRLVQAVDFAQTSDAEDPLFLVFRGLEFGHERDFPVVIIEADACQAFVRDALFQVQRAEVTVIDAFFGQRLVKLHHQRLVFGTDRADGHGRFVLQFPRPDVLHRIRADGWLGQFVFRRFGIVQNDARVERINPFRRSEQWIDVNFRNPRLFNHELAEAHEQLLQRRDVDCLASAHALERGENPRAFHHAPRERGVQRRQTERAVLINFDELAAGAEQQHWSKLLVNAASNNQFITFQLDHRLHGDAEKMFLANFFGDGRFNRLPRLADGGGRAQVQLDAAHVGLVRDGFGMQFQHDGEAEPRGFFHGVTFAQGNVRLHSGNGVGGEQLFGFKFRENRATGFSHFGNYFRRLVAVNVTVTVVGRRRRRFIKRAQIFAVAPHIIKRLRGAVRVFERRNFYGVENVL